MKKLFQIGKYVQSAIDIGLKAEKGIKTFSAFLKHLKAFEEERKQIWGIKENIPKVETKTS